MMYKQLELRIIIIDNNPSTQSSFAKILRTNIKSTDKTPKATFFLPEFYIDAVNEGKEALSRIRQAKNLSKPYALAFVNNFSLDGFYNLELIKKIWNLDSDIQIVICTKHTDYALENAIVSLKKRANLLILKKPFDNLALKLLTCALTKKWQLIQETRCYSKLLEERTNSLKKSLKNVEYQATHDLLTRLPNRALFHDRIRQAIAESRRNKYKCALLFLDVDRFKLINDSFSHEIGDKLLQIIAKRVSSIMREMDTFARLGGDEFVGIITCIKKAYEDLSIVASKILAAFKEPFKIGEIELQVYPSIGISVFPKDGKSEVQLLRTADSAMYRAKELGGNQFQFYTDEMDKETINKLQLERDLQLALQNKEFVLCYQPQFSLVSDKLISVEALIRWQHPKKGLLLPMNFIKIAEETGQISSISDWVLYESCKQNKIWQDQGFDKFRVAINLSSQQLRRTDFVIQVKKILEQTGLEPQYLEFELPEKMLSASVGCANTIKELKSLGISFAIDDFGTDYSNLNYLNDLPIDRLKIDQSFIHNIDVNRGDEILIQAIITLAKNLNLEIIAEGVETKKQLSFLKSSACQEAQGYLFAKPFSPADLSSFLSSRN